MISIHDDPLVPVTDYGLLEEALYHQRGLSPENHCRVRRSVAERLVRARTTLPTGYNFKIWDGYRPTAVQQALYEEFYKQLQLENPELTVVRLHTATQLFVSTPTTDPEKAAPHNTGGTVDLTIVDAEGRELDMGTTFDHFDVEAYTFHYEKASDERGARLHAHRMMLFNALIGEGFCNFPQEWWHFSYGDRVWAAHYGKDILYASCETF